MSRFYTAEPVPVVCTFDPAIDEDATGKEAWIQYDAERDVRLLKMREGAQPTTYWVTRLTPTQYAIINRTATNEAHKYELGFYFGLVRATNLDCQDGTHRDEFIPKYISDPKPRQQKQLSQAEFDMFDPDAIYEIGAVAYSRTPLLKGKPVFFPLPDSSKVALERMEASFRLAATLRRITQDRDPRSPEQPPSTSASGAPHGDASAPASQ